MHSSPRKLGIISYQCNPAGLQDLTVVPRINKEFPSDVVINEWTDQCPEDGKHLGSPQYSLGVVGVHHPNDAQQGLDAGSLQVRCLLTTVWPSDIEAVFIKYKSVPICMPDLLFLKPVHFSLDIDF